MSNKYIALIIAVTILIFCSNCTKFVQVPPPITELIGTSTYNSNSTASAAVTGIYLTMAGNSVGGGSHGISTLAGLSADELSLYSGSTDELLDQTYTNSLQSNNPATIWADLYNCIYQANFSIEELSNSSSVAPGMIMQLTGEAKFIRAFCLFYLVNLYGDVPLVTSTNYKINEALVRTPKSEVYQQIAIDLTDAQTLLSDNYNTPDGAVTNERVRPNKSAATALLARTYLYEQKWDSAAAAASEVISNGQYTLNVGLDSVFLSTSTEAIWQLEAPDNGANTLDGAEFVIPIFYYPDGPNVFYPVFLSNSVANAFEPGDLRRVNWVDSISTPGAVYYYPYKYKLYYTGQPATEYSTLLRLAEQFLIRAEAEAYGAGSGIIGAISDLNIIRNRAGLPNYSGPQDQGSLVSAILRERRVELFTEYGHRWLDLQRTNSIDSVMQPICAQKGGSWNINWQLYPIPLADIQTDSRLVQNTDY